MSKLKDRLRDAVNRTNERLGNVKDALKKGKNIPSKVYRAIDVLLGDREYFESAVFGFFMSLMAIFVPKVFVPMAAGSALFVLGIRAKSKVNDEILKDLRRQPEAYISGLLSPVVFYSAYVFYVGGENVVLREAARFLAMLLA